MDMKIQLSKDAADNICYFCVDCSICDFELGDTPWKIVECDHFVHDRESDLLVKKIFANNWG